MIPRKAQGSNLWAGEGTPSNSLGVNGNDYQDILTTNYYVKISGSWVRLNIGPSGSQGPQGIQGVAGPTGPAGPSGVLFATAPLAYDSGTKTVSIDLSNIAPINSPTFTGIPVAPTASPGTNTTQLATTAFVQSQGFVTSLSAMPSAHQSSTAVVTSATTTYVTAISTTITTTATSAKVYAKATATFTVTGAVPTVLKYRVSINGVTGQEQLLSLTALTTNYTAAIQYISAALGPGTYAVLFEIARNSGTGTVSFFEGTLDAVGLQGAGSNGITQLTGDITAGAGSGSQVATIANAAVTGAKIANTTITAANIANATITNTQLANATINLTTKVTGVLPFANGGTGATGFASTRIPFSNGTNFLGDSMFLYNSATQQFVVGNGAGTGRISGVVLTTDINPAHIAGNFYSRGTGACLQGQNENTLPTLSLVNAGSSLGALISTGFNRGTLVSRTQSLSGDTLFSLVTNGYTGSTFTTGNSGGISVIASENTVVGSQGGEIVLSTTPNGSNVSIERIRLKNSGEAVFSKAIATANMTTAAKNALTPSAGWVVFDTTLSQLSYYNGSVWVNI